MLDKAILCPLVSQNIYGCNDERGENGDGEDGRQSRLPDIMYVDDLIFCGKLLSCIEDISKSMNIKTK